MPLDIGVCKDISEDALEMLTNLEAFREGHTAQLVEWHSNQNHAAPELCDNVLFKSIDLMYDGPFAH